MKPGLQTVAAACGALFLQTNASSFAGENQSSTLMKPLGEASFELGAKHVVGYFLPANGRCRLTLMIAETEGETAAPAARVMLAIEPGRGARFDSENGESLKFECESGAVAMSATRLATLAALAADD
jgi:hypothetical protein